MLATKITPYEVQNGPKMHPKMSPKMDPKIIQNGPQERSLSESTPGGPREAQNLTKQTKTTPGKSVRPLPPLDPAPPPPADPPLPRPL